MADSKKSGPKRIIDVAHPGKTPAAATSKPVIVGNRPILKDPMMVEDSVTEEETPLSKVGGTTVIKPLTAPEISKSDKKENPVSESNEEPEAADPADEDAKPDNSKTIAQLAEEARVREEEASEKEPEDNATEPEVKPDSESSPEPEATDQPSDSESVADSPEMSKDQAAEDEKKKKQEEAVEKLIDDKQYYLPINTVEKRRSKRVVVGGALLSLLLAVAWADIALDAGLISSADNIPHTHFFKLSGADDAASQGAGPAVAPPTSAASAKSKYVSKVDKASFAYPKNWRLNGKKVTGFPEWLELSPNAAARKNQAGDYMLLYERNAGAGTGSTNSRPSVEAPSSKYTVVYVNYQQLPDTAANIPLYVQQFVVQDQTTGRFMPYLNIATSNTVLRSGVHITSAGDVLSLPFVINNEKDSLTFGGGLIPNDTDGKAGLSTLENAQKFMQGNIFKQANDILLSFKAVKR